MELRDFVAEALVKIQEGVLEAITRMEQNEQGIAAINPMAIF